MNAVNESDAFDSARDDGITLPDLLVPLATHWRMIVFGSLASGLAALGVAFLLTPVYTARTSFLPPQQQQSGLATAMASLGAVGGLAGLAGGGGIKSAADLYVALMQSVTIEDRLVEKFKLVEVYDVKYRFEARKALERKSPISIGKKDGLISVEVEDKDPQRAADIANAYVAELVRMTSVLAVSEAQQRRAFFERELKEARDQLARAQRDLQSSGFSIGALRAEPRSAAEGYARLKAEITASEVRLEVMRRSMAESAPELQQQVAQLSALRDQLARLERANDVAGGGDYVTKYRDFKYREALFDLYARQFELARADESREGGLIQVVDPALKPEYRSGPKRGLIAVAATVLSLLSLSVYFVTRHSWRQAAKDPRTAEKIEQLRAAIN